MRKENLELDEIKLVGIAVRTNNQDEMNPGTSKIGATLERYFSEGMSKKISQRVRPGTTYCVYTEYESDEHGEYTYFVGEEVETFVTSDPLLRNLSIPASTYAKIEVGPGEKIALCIDTWKKIWKMTRDDFGGERAYRADFEVYDARAADPSRAIFDIYIGLK